MKIEKQIIELIVNEVIEKLNNDPYIAAQIIRDHCKDREFTCDKCIFSDDGECRLKGIPDMWDV